MLPTRMEAERLLEEAEKYNPGPWGNHSRVAAHCAEKIALGCEGMNPEKASKDIYDLVEKDSYTLD